MRIGRWGASDASTRPPGPESPAEPGDEVHRGHEPPVEPPPYLPLGASALVIVALLALVTTPVLMTWRIDALQAETDATTGRGHILTDSLKTLFIDEIILLEQVRRGDPHSGAHYRRVRALQDGAIASLGELAPQISVVVADRVQTIARLSARWHTGPDAFMARPISEQQARGEMWRILADRDTMLVAEQQLDDEVHRVAATRRARGGKVLIVQRWLSIGFGLLAAVAAVVVAWFAARARRLRRSLARTNAISEQRRTDLLRITESRNRLMRGFSHDVKNPIGAADGYMQLLAEGVLGPVGEKQRSSIARARASMKAALHLINDLLEIATIESDHISIVRVPMDVAAVAAEAAEQYRAMAEAKGLTLLVDAGEATTLIVGDPDRVRQVLANLISNAVKYTPAGQVAVHVGRERDPEGHGRLSIAVSDTGLGIEKERQRLLFQEFVRLDPAAGPGVGIGLAMSARIVEALGGTITVRSQRGQGSVFVLWLPTDGSPPASTPRTAHEQTHPAGKGGGRTDE